MATSKSGLPAPFQGGQGASRFFKRFEVACSINKWESDEDRALHVLPLFGDSVFDFSVSLADADRKSYTKLKAAIIKQYDSAILTTSVAEQFGERKQKKGESLTELMMALKTLAEKAYSELPEPSRERLVRDQFIKSLPAEIHNHVLLQPKMETSDALLAEALKAEEVYGSTAQTTTVAEVSTPLESITKMLQTLTAKVDKLEASQEASVSRVQNSSFRRETPPNRGQFRSREFRGNCYKCHQQGHMARECPNEAAVCTHCKNPGHSKEQCAIRGKVVKDF